MINSVLSGERYRYSPVSPLYLYGRPQDLALQKARDNIHQRNHLRLWMSPMQYHGKPVWVGQISRDIGTRFTIHSPYLTTHKIDPDVDAALAALVEDMAYSQNLTKIGMVKGVGAAPIGEPRENLTTDPYYTNGLRGVLVFDRTPTALTGIEFLPWEGAEGGFFKESMQRTHAMRRPVTVHLALHGMRQTVAIMTLVVALLFGLGGCASWQAPAQRMIAALRARAVSDTVKDVTLSATVLGTADSEQLFGTDIKGTGVQPIWIEVRNHSTHTLWLLRSGTDPSYYSPLEVAWPLHSKFAKKSNARIDAYYNALDFKSPIPPGAVRSGILFVNPHRGTYVLNVDLLGQQSIYPFTLFLPIPGEHKVASPGNTRTSG